MKKSLSIVNTSIQLINCIEAIHHYECTYNYLLIGQFNIYPERIKKIQKMLEDPFFSQHFKKIYYLPYQFSSKNPLRFVGYLVSAMKFAFIIFFSKKFDFCFYGVYTDVIMRPITYLIKYKNKKSNICLVDEGVRILADANLRIKQEPLILRQEQKSKCFIRDFCLSIVRRWLVPNLNYFTIYSLPYLKRDTIVLNDYSYLKSNNPYHYDFKQNAIVLIGQPFIELKFVEAQTYISILNKIFTLYQGRPIYYVPHPIESLYPKYIPREIEFITTTLPIEILLLGSNVSTLIGFNSSVLFNSAKMNICRDIQCYKIHYDEYLCNVNIEDLDYLYRTFVEAKITLIE